MVLATLPLLLGTPDLGTADQAPPSTPIHSAASISGQQRFGTGSLVKAAATAAAAAAVESPILTQIPEEAEKFPVIFVKIDQRKEADGNTYVYYRYDINCDGQTQENEVLKVTADVAKDISSLKFEATKFVLSLLGQSAHKKHFLQNSDWSVVFGPSFVPGERGALYEETKAEINSLLQKLEKRETIGKLGRIEAKFKQDLLLFQELSKTVIPIRMDNLPGFGNFSSRTGILSLYSKADAVNVGNYQTYFHELSHADVSLSLGGASGMVGKENKIRYVELDYSGTRNRRFAMTTARYRSGAAGKNLEYSNPTAHHNEVLSFLRASRYMLVKGEITQADMDSTMNGNPETVNKIITTLRNKFNEDSGFRLAIIGSFDDLSVGFESRAITIAAYFGYSVKKVNGKTVAVHRNTDLHEYVSSITKEYKTLGEGITHTDSVLRSK